MNGVRDQTKACGPSEIDHSLIKPFSFYTEAIILTYKIRYSKNITFFKFVFVNVFKYA